MNQLDEQVAMARRRDLDHELDELSLLRRMKCIHNRKRAVRFWNRVAEWAAARAENARD